MGIEPTTYGLRNRCRVRGSGLNRSVFARRLYAHCTVRTPRTALAGGLPPSTARHRLDREPRPDHATGAPPGAAGVG